MTRSNTYSFVTEAPTEQLEAVLRQYEQADGLSVTQLGVQHLVRLMLKERASIQEVKPAPRLQLLIGGK